MVLRTEERGGTRDPVDARRYQGGLPVVDVDESAVEDLVRRAIQATYAPGKLDRDVDYVDVSYESYEDGRHLLRARAPMHAVLGYERWVAVGLQDQRVHIRGAGHSGQNEFYVQAIIED